MEVLCIGLSKVTVSVMVHIHVGSLEYVGHMLTGGCY